MAAEEADVSAISPLSSAGLCRSISRSYSSPEPDYGGGGGVIMGLNGVGVGSGSSVGIAATSISNNGAMGGSGSGASSGQQSDTEAKQQYHCSSTTASVPGEFSNRHRSSQVLFYFILSSY